MDEGFYIVTEVRSLIEIRHVTKSFAIKSETLTALDDVSLSIQDGDLVGVIGMSGAGKTTLLRCLSLLEKPDSGEILIDGENLLAAKDKKLTEYRKKIGVVFQGYHLLEQATVSQNIAFPLELNHEKKEVVDKRVQELIQLVDLRGKEHVYPSQLSGGQKQRVAIARALASSPKLLLCDEPTSALDALTTRSILQLLSDIHLKTGVTILIITHELLVVKSICQRVVVINEGKFVEEGLVKEVFAHPKHDNTRLLLGLEVTE